MKKFVKLAKRIAKDEKGYGTVELLILVAALGVLATGLMVGLSAAIGVASDGTVTNDGTVDNIKDQLQNMVENWGS